MDRALARAETDKNKGGSKGGKEKDMGGKGTVECWICGGNHYQSDCPKKDTKGKGKGKKSDGKKGDKGKAEGEKTKVPLPVDVHTETFKKVSVIIGEDGMAPCLHHIAMGSCPATDCPRSHDASKHKLTD